MRRLLVAATMLSMLGGVAFANGFGQPQGWIAAGDVNMAVTGAASNAGVSSIQGTQAGAKVNGAGGVLVGTVSGNYTSVTTGATGAAGPAGSTTTTTAQQVNLGGTVSGGLGLAGQQGGHGYVSPAGATGFTSGGQSSQDSGSSQAMAKNVNLGGFVAVKTVGRPSGH